MELEKRCKRNGKETAVAVEVEKKKPVGRKKKAAAVHVEEPEGETSPASTKQRGKRTGVQVLLKIDFVGFLFVKFNNFLYNHRIRTPL